MVFYKTSAQNRVTLITPWIYTLVSASLESINTQAKNKFPTLAYKPYYKSKYNLDIEFPTANHLADACLHRRTLHPDK